MIVLNIFHCSFQLLVGGTLKLLLTKCEIFPSVQLSRRFAAVWISVFSFCPSRISLSRSTCFSCVSKRSKNWLTLVRKCSGSPDKGSPVSNLVIPGFRSLNVNNKWIICCVLAKVESSSPRITEILEKTVSSMNSIRVSNIFVLLEKWRYRAASETPTCFAKRAVVILDPGLSSSIEASANSICSFRVTVFSSSNLRTRWY